MSDIDDLGYTSITEAGNDEAIELLRQIRLSRRIPTKKVTKTTKKQKAKAAPELSPEQAAKLLELLGGK